MPPFDHSPFCFFERTQPAASMRPPCLIYLSTSNYYIAVVGAESRSSSFYLRLFAIRFQRAPVATWGTLSSRTVYQVRDSSIIIALNLHDSSSCAPTKYVPLC